MSARSWRERLEAMVEDLKRNPRVKVELVEFQPPASSDDIAFAKEQAGGELPAGCSALYEEVNGFTLSWQLKEKLSSTLNDRGDIRLLPIKQVFGAWQGATWFPEPRKDVRYQPIQPFDHFVTEACAAFQVSSGQPLEDKVYFHYFGESTVDTGYSFEAYLTRLLQSRGYWYWIQALSKHTCENPEAEAFLTAGPQIFDDFDPSLFSPR